MDSVQPGTAITCVIENDDLAEPPQTASVTIIKSVINDNGGTLGVNDFGLFVGNSTNVLSGTTVIIPANTTLT